MNNRRHVGLALVTLSAALSVVVIACGQSQDAPSGGGESEVVDSEPGQVPTLGTRIDRVGRPEVSTFLVRAPATALSEYNSEDSFADNSAKYLPAIEKSLAMYDRYDSTVDMDEAMVSKLAKVLADDSIRIDLSKPCAVLPTTGYLDLERAELTGEEPKSCGGRSPNEDAFDTLATFYTNGPARLTPKVTDLVNASTGPAVETFPYLVKPHLLRAPPAPAPSGASTTEPRP